MEAEPSKTIQSPKHKIEESATIASASRIKISISSVTSQIEETKISSIAKSFPRGDVLLFIIQNSTDVSVPEFQVVEISVHKQLSKGIVEVSPIEFPLAVKNKSGGLIPPTIVAQREK